MKKILIIGMLLGMGLLGVMAVNLTENPLVEVGHFQDVVTKSTPVVDVRAYGAVGDGTTDDTPAFELAHAAAVAAGGASVFVPPGTYRVQMTITTDGAYSDSPHVTWKGAGANASRLQAIDANDFVITMTGNAAWEWFWSIEGIGFIGGDVTAGETRDTGGFYYNDSTPSVIGVAFRDCSFFNCDVGFKNKGGLWYTFENCTFSRNNIGVWIEPRDYGVSSAMHGGCGWFVRCNWYINQLAAIYLINSSNRAGIEQLRFLGGVNEGNPGFAIFAKATGTQQVVGRNWELSFDDFYYELNGTASAVTLGGTEYTTVEAVHLENVDQARFSNSKIANMEIGLTDTRLVFDKCWLYGGLSITKSGNSSARAEECRIDHNVGCIDTYSEGYTSPLATLRKPVVPIPLSSEVSLERTNLVSTGSCAVAFTAVDANGLTYSFENVAAPMFDRCLKLTELQGAATNDAYDGIRLWNFTNTVSKWYYWSVDARADDADTVLQITSVGGDAIIRGDTPGLPCKAGVWRRFSGITYSTFGNASEGIWAWQNSGAAETFYLSAMQVVQFDTFQECMEYSRQGRYAWPATLPFLPGSATAIVDLTNANIKDLADTPIELVAAQGAGTLIEVLSAVLILDYGTNALTEPSDPDDLAIEYDDGTGAQIITWDTTAFITAVADTIEQVNVASIVPFAAAANVNKNVVLLNTGGDYEGNAGADTTMRVIVTYKVHTSLGL